MEQSVITKIALSQSIGCALASNPDLEHLTTRTLEIGQASRPISTGQLHTFMCFHTRPISS